MAPDDAAGGGFELLPEDGENPKFPKFPKPPPPEELLAMLLLLSRAFGGKDVAVGEAKSCSSSSWRLPKGFMPALLEGAVVPPKGLDKPFPDSLECCPNLASSRCAFSLAKK